MLASKTSPWFSPKKPAGQGPKHLVFVHGAKYPNVLMDKFLHQLGSKQDWKLKSNNFWTLWIFCGFFWCELREAMNRVGKVVFLAIESY